MANTTYKETYEIFLDKITDYEFASFPNELQEDILQALLKSACRRFDRICIYDLMSSEESPEGAKSFTSELGGEELDIITELMCVEWLKPFMNDTDNLHNRINTAEFSSVSPANMLTAIRDTYSLSRKNARSLMNQYSYVHGDMAELIT